MIRIHVVTGTSMWEAERRLAESRKGKLHTFHWARTTTRREPECIASINLSEVLLQTEFLD